VVNEYEMYLVLSVFLALDLVIMTAWSLTNPFYPEMEYFPREKPDMSDKDIEFLPQLLHCRSQNLNIWYGKYIAQAVCRDNTIQYSFNTTWQNASYSYIGNKMNKKKTS